MRDITFTVGSTLSTTKIHTALDTRIQAKIKRMCKDDNSKKDMATCYRRPAIDDLRAGDSASNVLVRTLDSATGVVQGPDSPIHPALRFW